MPIPGKSVQSDTQPHGRATTFARQLAVATELPFTLVAGVVVGGLIGYGFDRLLGTRPVCLLLFGAVGFFAGLREILRRVGKGGSGSGQSPSA
jgi:ATP synthase protein I